MLVAELEAIDREWQCSSKIDGRDDECERLYERHWALRALINVTPVRSSSELRAKARALQIEIARDGALNATSMDRRANLRSLSLATFGKWIANRLLRKAA